MLVSEIIAFQYMTIYNYSVKEFPQTDIGLTEDEGMEFLRKFEVNDEQYQGNIEHGEGLI